VQKAEAQQTPPARVLLAPQAAKRTYSRLLSFPLNLALLAGETTAVQAQQAPRLGRNRKIDKLTARENQHPKQRTTSGHTSRLESRPEPLVRTSYRKIGRCLQFDAACWSQQQPSMHIVPFITPTVFYTNQNIPTGRNQFSQFDLSSCRFQYGPYHQYCAHQERHDLII
jgi:hypothetical protein